MAEHFVLFGGLFGLNGRSCLLNVVGCRSCFLHLIYRSVFARIILFTPVTLFALLGWPIFSKFILFSLFALSTLATQLPIYIVYFIWPIYRLYLIHFIYPM